jgi:hypothetical protein
VQGNRAWVLFALFLFVLAAAVPSRSATIGKVTIVGTLTSEGVECPALKGDDGVLYTLALRTAGSLPFPGARLQVEGTVADISICQQGTTIEVEKVTPVDTTDSAAPPAQ